MQWEQDMAVARSEGQFFKSLYQSDAKRPVGADAQALRVRGRRFAKAVVWGSMGAFCAPARCRPAVEQGGRGAV